MKTNQKTAPDKKSVPDFPIDSKNQIRLAGVSILAASPFSPGCDRRRQPVKGRLFACFPDLPGADDTFFLFRE